jgi:predicted PurR-regulated permease PerM
VKAFRTTLSASEAHVNDDRDLLNHPAADPSRSESSAVRHRARQASMAVWIGLLLVTAAVTLWYAVEVVLLVFLGLLLAIVLRTLAEWAAKRTGLRVGVSLALLLAGLLGLALLAGWTLFPAAADQLDQLGRTLPAAAEQARTHLRQYEWGRWVLTHLGEMGGPNPGTIAGTARGLLSAGASAIVNVVVVLFLGVYLAADPARYHRGLLRLVPPARRPRAAEWLDTVGFTLRWWLLGQLAAMLLVGGITAAGLLLLGVPSAFGLGLLAGTFEFVPVLGPFAAAVPGLLVAAQEGRDTVLWVGLLYLGVQTAEGYLLTPLVQSRAVHLPPALTIVAQLLLGTLLGVLGVLVAVPLMAVALVSVQMLHVEDVLNDRMEVAGEADARERVSARAR